MNPVPQDAPESTPVNRTAMAKESLDRMKQEWPGVGLRLGEAERVLARAEKTVALHAENLRALEASKIKKVALFSIGRLASTRQRLNDELARAEKIRRLAEEAFATAKSNKDLLRDAIAELESGIKKPKLCENRLTDFRENYA